MDKVNLAPQHVNAMKMFDKLKAMGLIKDVNEIVGDGWVKTTIFPTGSMFQKIAPDGILMAMVELRKNRGDDPKIFPNGRWHISLSHNSGLRQAHAELGDINIPKRLPTWDELLEARKKFTPPDVNMAIMMPPPDKYVNIHGTCLHLLQIPVELALDPGPLGAI